MKLTGGKPQCFRSPWRRLLQLPVSPLRTSARLQRTPNGSSVHGGVGHVEPTPFVYLGQRLLRGFRARAIRDLPGDFHCPA